MALIRRIFIGVAVFVAVLLLLNLGYIKKQVQYVFSGKQTQTSIPVVKNDSTKTVEPNILKIESLNISAPIQYVDEANENKFQEALQKGVVHYPGSAEIGGIGNAYIFGHSSDFAFTPGNYKNVFALLPKIELGVEILVSDKFGKQFKYKVYDKYVVAKDDVAQLSQNTNGEKILTVQTSYPVGTALKRYIVKAMLVE